MILSVLIMAGMIFWYLWPPTGIFPLTCHSWTRKWWCGGGGGGDIQGHTGTHHTCHYFRSPINDVISSPPPVLPPSLNFNIGRLIFQQKLTTLKLTVSLVKGIPTPTLHNLPSLFKRPKSLHSTCWDADSMTSLQPCHRSKEDWFSFYTFYTLRVIKSSSSCADNLI